MKQTVASLVVGVGLIGPVEYATQSNSIWVGAAFGLWGTAVVSVLAWALK